MDRVLMFNQNNKEIGLFKKVIAKHYLYCLRKQCQNSVRSTYRETKNAHLVMLETAEQLLSGLGEKGIKGRIEIL